MIKCKYCKCPILISKKKSNFGRFCSGSCSEKYNNENLEKNGCIEIENIQVNNLNIEYKIGFRD